jgi:hypothetical protein
VNNSRSANCYGDASLTGAEVEPDDAQFERGLQYDPTVIGPSLNRREE